MAPLQKAGIVALIKNRTDDMTLAIGDGNNLLSHVFFIEFQTMIRVSLLHIDDNGEDYENSKMMRETAILCQM